MRVDTDIGPNLEDGKYANWGHSLMMLLMERWSLNYWKKYAHSRYDVERWVCAEMVGKRKTLIRGIYTILNVSSSKCSLAHENAINFVGL